MSRRIQKLDKTESTRERALREAQDLLQTQGFNGFSFQHVADRLGINKASLYSHFESKEQLGQAIVADYRRQFTQWSEVLSTLAPELKLSALFELFHKFSLDDYKICPLSALTVDMRSLPARVQKDLCAMSEFQLKWIEDIINEGKRLKKFKTKRSAKELAPSIMSLGLGAQLTARLMKNSHFIREAREKALVILQAA